MAQVNSLTFTPGATPGAIQLLADDHSGNTDTVNITLVVTPEINGTYTGNAGANRLDGAGGNDLIDGRGGADMMFGGSGNDRFVVDNAGDRVFEGVGKGTDMVYSSISQTLAANVENLVLTGTAANGVGNSLNNQIFGNGSFNKLFGNAGNDTLYGNAGNDTLNGGAGNDVLTGGTNRDMFVFSTALNSTTNRDRISTSITLTMRCCWTMQSSPGLAVQGRWMRVSSTRALRRPMRTTTSSTIARRAS